VRRVLCEEGIVCGYIPVYSVSCSIIAKSEWEHALFVAFPDRGFRELIILSIN